MDRHAYLHRIGLRRSPAPDVGGLKVLHRAHLQNVPFENLHIRARIPIELQPDRLYDKIVRQRRGGFCYELNGLFAVLLEELGFRLDRIQGQVYEARRQRFGPPFDHMALLVHVEGQRYLADVGFGDLFLEPLPLQLGQEFPDGGRTFALDEDEEGHVVLRRANGRSASPMYRFSTAPHALEDFTGMCRHHQTSPHSHFTQRTVCTMALPEGRVTLTDQRTIMTHQSRREEHSIKGDGFRSALWDHFGMTPPEALH